MYYVLDTHILVWFFEGGEKLGKKCKEIFNNNQDLLVIPSITLAEIKHLISRKRINVDLQAVILAIESDPRCRIYPLDLTVVEKMSPNLEIHDAIICATAMVYRDILKEKVKLITRDDEIIKAKIIETLF
ncbi:PIN domain-containing protein [Candidatus Saganbacteria bacterium]|nr:PIN domain-containing protein [Candidatus Saganbacteria bacterium]